VKEPGDSAENRPLCPLADSRCAEQQHCWESLIGHHTSPTTKQAGSAAGREFRDPKVSDRESATSDRRKFSVPTVTDTISCGNH